MARTGTRPVLNKVTGSSQTATDQTYVDEKAIQPALNDAWSSTVKFDDMYMPPLKVMDSNITYSIDATNAATGNSRWDRVVGDGNTIDLSAFEIGRSDLTVTAGVVTTVNEAIYDIVFSRRGSVSMVHLVDSGETYTAPDVTPPTSQSVTVENSDTDALIWVLDEAVNITNVVGLSLNGDWSGITITGINSGSGTDTISLAIDTPIANGETGSLVFGATNTVEDLSGNALAAGSTAVTNNVAGIAFNTHSLSTNNSGFITVSNTALAMSDGATDSPFSFEAIAKFPTLGALEHINLLIPSGQTGAILSKSSANIIGLTLYTDSSNYINSYNSSVLSANTWYHIVGTYDGTKSNAGIKIYINGSVGTQVPGVNGSYTGMPDQSSSCLYYISNSISEIIISWSRLFNKELSSSEVSTLYASRLTGCPVALQGNLIQESLLNNNANSNVGAVNGVETPTVSYTTDIPS